HKINSFVGLM
uniref:Neurokinin-A n=2 Tax=Euteleosteomorpha TaxID=1489388 RepID=TKNB_GADMO|nr:RecName: Full=Neurokinin-A; AltName: Full=Neuromedin-L; AltName: Full=Substance K [Oncorhynchus mykiss]P69144.1 RecName: Full=Neurokinin-A; AltName: Full=Neuromedin-L; AltName: Full=Substance K [Gadus morhua]